MCYLDKLVKRRRSRPKSGSNDVFAALVCEPTSTAGRHRDCVCVAECSRVKTELRLMASVKDEGCVME